MKTKIVSTDELNAERSLRAEDYVGVDITLRILQAIFYDLAKEVPIGLLNRILLENISIGKAVRYSDRALEGWALQSAKAIMTRKPPFEDRRRPLPERSQPDAKKSCS